MIKWKHSFQIDKFIYDLIQRVSMSLNIGYFKEKRVGIVAQLAQ